MTVPDINSNVTINNFSVSLDNPIGNQTDVKSLTISGSGELFFEIGEELIVDTIINLSGSTAQIQSNPGDALCGVRFIGNGTNRFTNRGNVQIGFVTEIAGVGRLIIENRNDGVFICENISLHRVNSRITNWKDFTINQNLTLANTATNFLLDNRRPSATGTTENFAIHGDIDFGNASNAEIRNYRLFDLNGNIINCLNTLEDNRAAIIQFDNSIFSWSGNSFDADLELFCNDGNHDLINTFVYDRNGDQPIIEPHYGEYWHLILQGSGSKTIQSPDGGLIDGSVYVIGDFNIEESAVLDINSLSIHFQGNYTNNGPSHTYTNGTVYFDINAWGTNPPYDTLQDKDQFISGNETFYNLYFRKDSNAVFFNNSITVTRSLAMEGVIINMGNNKLAHTRVNYDALEYTSGVIIGRYERLFHSTAYDNQTYLFPVGSATTFNGIAIKGDYNSGRLIVQYVPSAPTCNGLPFADAGVKLRSPFPEGYWTMKDSAGFLATNCTVKAVTEGLTTYTKDADNRLMRRLQGNTWPDASAGVHAGVNNDTIARSGMSFAAGATYELALGSDENNLTVDSHPADVTLCMGGTATFSVTSATAIGYQWQRNGVDLTNGGDISGATSQTLQIANTSEDNLGLYSCMISDGCNYFSSDNALLEITLPESGLGYAWQKVLRVDHTQVGGTNVLRGFPVLVSITNDDELKDIDNGGYVENPNGWDIILPTACRTSFTTNYYRTMEQRVV